MIENDEMKEVYQRLLAGTLMEAEADNLFVQTQSLETLMTMYQCAITKLCARIDVVKAEYEIKHHRNPVEYVETRIKKPLHILEKLNRKGYDFSLESIVYNLNDVAGIRLVCSFLDDIYQVADMILHDETFKLVERVDYIKSPKASGYRSLHLIIEVPIIFSDVVQKMKVEVQLRTMAMDFWATLEHQIYYKKEISDADKKIATELKECADVIYETDRRMHAIREKLNELTEPKG